MSNLQVSMFRPRRALQQQHQNGEAKSGGAGGGVGGAAGKMLLKKITVNHMPKKKKFSIIWWIRSPLRHCKIDLDHRLSIFFRPWNLSSSAALYFHHLIHFSGPNSYVPFSSKSHFLPLVIRVNIYQTRAIVFIKNVYKLLVDGILSYAQRNYIPEHL